MRTAIYTFILLSVALGQPSLLARSPAAEISSPSASQSDAVRHVYKLRVKDHWMALRTIKDLVDLLGGTSTSKVLKGSRPQTIRMELSLPQGQSTYFLSKLSGLGQRITPPGGAMDNQGLQNSGVYRMSLDIFDP